MDANHPSVRIHLVLGGSDGELEVDTLAGQSLVDLRVGVEAVVNTTTLLLVKNDLEDLGAVLLGAHALANDLDGVDEVGKDGVVDSSQSARTRALLGLAGARAVAALGAGQDAAGSDDEDVAVGELLLELTGQAERALVGADGVFMCVCVCLPLLDLVEALELGNGDEDDNGLSAVTNLDLKESWCQRIVRRPVPTASSIDQAIGLMCVYARAISFVLSLLNLLVKF